MIFKNKGGSGSSSVSTSFGTYSKHFGDYKMVD